MPSQAKLPLKPISIKRIASVLMLIGFVAYSMNILLGSFFIGTPLQIWRQLMSALLLSMALTIVLPRMKVDISGMVFLVLTSAALLLSLYSLMRGFSLMRVGYAFFAYVGLSVFLLTNRIFEDEGKLDTLHKTLFFLLIVASVGLLIDYFSDALQGIPRAEMSNDLEDLSLGHLRRASFLFGASTLVYPFLSFCFVAIIVYYRKLGAPRIGLLWLLVTLGLFVTLSRAAIVAWAILTIFLGIVWISQRMSIGRVFKIMVSIGLILFVATFLMPNISLQSDLAIERLSDPFSSEDNSNQVRIEYWLLGLKLFNFSPELIFGYGLGSTMGQIPDKMPVFTHYESSFFQAMHEGGLFGLLIRYLPAVVAYWMFLKNKNARRRLDLKMYAAWLFVYLFVIFLAPTAGAFHNQLVYFYVCGLLIYRSQKYKHNINCA